MAKKKTILFQPAKLLGIACALSLLLAATPANARGPFDDPIDCSQVVPGISCNDTVEYGLLSKLCAAINVAGYPPLKDRDRLGMISKVIGASIKIDEFKFDDADRKLYQIETKLGELEGATKPKINPDDADDIGYALMYAQTCVDSLSTTSTEAAVTEPVSSTEVIVTEVIVTETATAEATTTEASTTEASTAEATTTEATTTEATTAEATTTEATTAEATTTEATSTEATSTEATTAEATTTEATTTEATTTEATTTEATTTEATTAEATTAEAAAAEATAEEPSTTL